MKCIGRTSQIILLFVVVLITGCGADGPAQFVDATNDMENWEVYFEKYQRMWPCQAQKNMA